MASPRKISKSESSAKPSSGSNSKRHSLSSNSSSVSSGREEIINLGLTEDIDKAEDYMKDWIKKEMKEPQGTWVARWGSKLTGGVKSGEGIASLGCVIGKDYIVEKKSDKEQNTDNPSYYRVDWDPKDPKKNLHYNAVLVSKAKDRYIAYPFGNQEKTLLRDPETDKAIGELSVTNKMMALTAAALSENELMTPEIAQRILKNFENPSPHIKEHFKELGFLLRDIISKSHHVILQSGKADTDGAYKFDESQLSTRVGEYLAEIWKLAITNQLDAILSESIPEYETDHAKKVILSECIFAASNKPFSEQVLNEFSNFVSPIEKDQQVNVFIDSVKDLADGNEPLLEEFQKRIFDLRRSSSPDLQDSKPEQTKKPISSSANAMLSMMFSRSQATQALNQAIQPSNVVSEPTMSQQSVSSDAKVSSSLEKIPINNTVDDKKQDSTKVEIQPRRMQH